MSLVNVATQLHLVMRALTRKGRIWPYMFDYSASSVPSSFAHMSLASYPRSICVALSAVARAVEISIPPTSWNQGKKGAWLLLQGCDSLIVHSTHIQFLTMLFPSALEARLILGLLGKSRDPAATPPQPLLCFSCSRWCARSQDLSRWLQQVSPSLPSRRTLP